MRIETFEQFVETEIGKEFLDLVKFNLENYNLTEITNLEDLHIVLVTADDDLDCISVECVDYYYEDEKSYITVNEIKLKSGILKYTTSKCQQTFDIEIEEIELLSHLEVILDKLNNYKQVKKQTKQELKTFVQDKSIALDDRWKALIEYSELTEKSRIVNFGLIERFDVEDEDYEHNIAEFYNACNFRFGETSTVQNILFEIKLFFAEASNLNSITPEEEITFKEYCCDNFIGSMIFDW